MAPHWGGLFQGVTLSTNVVSNALREGLYTRIIGRRILYFQRLPSTMDEACREGEAGGEEGTVVLAEEQTAGRGRFGRLWLSPRGNINLSVLLRPSLGMLTYLSILASIGVVRAIARATGLVASVKWPNDVLIGKRKVCGILVESALTGNEVGYAVVGIGVNVEFDPSQEKELSHTATSLVREVGGPVDRSALLRHLLEEMDALYLNLRDGWSPIEEWRTLLVTLGKSVMVRWQEEVREGHAEDVDQMGNLLLRQQDGSLVCLPAGEVSLVQG